MDGSAVQLIGAGLSGPVVWGTIIFLWRRLRRDIKNEAEARKIDVEADSLFVTRLWAEIERLDRELTGVREQLKKVESAAADEKTQLETENKRLRYEVSSLRRRVSQLEEIIKTKTTPEDMLARLADIDRKTVDK